MLIYFYREKIEMTTVSDALNLLQKGLRSHTKTFCGAKVLDSICEEKISSYFSTASWEIDKASIYTKRRLTNDFVVKTDYEINTLIDWVKKEYILRADFFAPKSELYNRLLPQVTNTLVPLVFALTDMPSTLGVFVLGATVHLILLQELAIIDPKVSDPTKSSHIADIRRYAASYADYADQTYRRLESQRINAISSVSIDFEMSAYPGTHGYRGYYMYFFTFKDSWSSGNIVRGERKADSKRVNELSQKAHSEYIHKATLSFKRSLNDPTSTAEIWRGLVKRPLPYICD